MQGYKSTMILVVLLPKISIDYSQNIFKCKRKAFPTFLSILKTSDTHKDSLTLRSYWWLWTMVNSK